MGSLISSTKKEQKVLLVQQTQKKYNLKIIKKLKMHLELHHMELHHMEMHLKMHHLEMYLEIKIKMHLEMHLEIIKIKINNKTNL